jgi:hypothetical protein
MLVSLRKINWAEKLPHPIKVKSRRASLRTCGRACPPSAHLLSGKIRRCCVDWLNSQPYGDITAVVEGSFESISSLRRRVKSLTGTVGVKLKAASWAAYLSLIVCLISVPQLSQT